MPDKILEKMRRGAYYPGHHLGPHEELDRLVAQGLLERMNTSSLCGPGSEPAYCLSDKGGRLATKKGGRRITAP